MLDEAWLLTPGMLPEQSLNVHPKQLQLQTKQQCKVLMSCYLIRSSANLQISEVYGNIDRHQLAKPCQLSIRQQTQLQGKDSSEEDSMTNGEVRCESLLQAYRFTCCTACQICTTALQTLAGAQG